MSTSMFRRYCPSLVRAGCFSPILSGRKEDIHFPYRVRLRLVLEHTSVRNDVLFITKRSDKNNRDGEEMITRFERDVSSKNQHSIVRQVITVFQRKYLNNDKLTWYFDFFFVITVTIRVLYPISTNLSVHCRYIPIFFTITTWSYRWNRSGISHVLTVTSYLHE